MCFKNNMEDINLGEHGFWGMGSVSTLGVFKKNFVAAFGGRKFFCRPRHQGVILLNRNEKKLPPWGSICPNIFSPWGYQGGGVYLYQVGVSGDFRF